MKIPANGFTHAGKFHADDVFATALLQILRPDIKITRGFTVPDDFDGIVYDIGFGMFDHHQEPREYRANGDLCQHIGNVVQFHRGQAIFIRDNEIIAQ